MTTDPGGKSGPVRAPADRQSAIAETVKAIRGTSSLAAGIGTTGAVAVWLKTTGGSTWTSELSKSFAGLDVGRGAASAVAEMSRAMSGASAFTSGLGESVAAFDVGLGGSAIAEMVKTISRTSSWTGELSKSFAGLDVGRGAASAVAEMSRTMSGASALTSGLGKSVAAFDVGLGSSAVADLVKTFSGASALGGGVATAGAVAAMLNSTGSTSAWTTGLSQSFAGLDVGRGAGNAIAEMSRALSKTSAGSGLTDVVELLSPALNQGLDAGQRRAFQIYAATMLACTGTHLVLTYPSASAIVLIALAIVQTSWWLATQGARRLP